MTKLKKGTFFYLLFCLFFSVTTAHAKRYIVRYKESSLEARTNGETRFKKFRKEIKTIKSDSELKKVKSQSDVLFVEEDVFLTTFYEPGDSSGTRDPEYDNQWHYLSNGINLPLAWDVTTGAAQQVVAVVDTGHTNHSEFSNRIVSSADMINDTSVSRDGDGRDNDGSDPGDYLNGSEACGGGQFKNSTWHGTHVLGTVGANAENGKGVVGVNWKARLVSVRVLGPCGGWLSDIADGIRWAAGGQVSGVATNPYPAKVINLSLGGAGACSQTLQEAIDYARSQKAVVIAAAGNDGNNMDWFPYQPATCRGVITVGATDSAGVKAFYSNYGKSVDVWAPGGSTFNGVLSLSNSGSQSPSTESYKRMSGTSMAAPHVAGVASLILAVNPDLYPAQVEGALRESSLSNGLLDARDAIDIASSMSPDPNYTVPEFSSGTTPISSAPVPIYTSKEESGGACGSITHVDGSGGGGPGGFLATLLFGILIFLPKFKLQNFA